MSIPGQRETVGPQPIPPDSKTRSLHNFILPHTSKQYPPTFPEMSAQNSSGRSPAARPPHNAPRRPSLDVGTAGCSPVSPVGTPRHSRSDGSASVTQSVASSPNPAAAALATQASRNEAARMCLLAEWSNNITRDAVASYTALSSFLKQSGQVQYVDEKLGRVMLDSITRVIVHNTVNVGKAVQAIESAQSSEAIGFGNAIAPSLSGRSPSAAPSTVSTQEPKGSNSSNPAQALSRRSSTSPSRQHRRSTTASSPLTNPPSRKRTSSQASTGSEDGEAEVQSHESSSQPTKKSRSSGTGGGSSAGGSGGSRPASRSAPRPKSSSSRSKTSQPATVVDEAPDAEH